MSIQSERGGDMAAIVFDFDGVLVDSEAAHGVALAAAAELLGLSAPEARPDWYIGLGDAECFNRMAAASGHRLRSDELSVLIERKAAAFAELVRSGGVMAFPGAPELMQATAEVVPVAVCSGSRRCDVEPVLTMLGLLPLLGALVTADDVARTKPDPEAYLVTASRLGVGPERCVAIEDSPTGIAAARAAGYLRVYAVCQTFDREQLGEAHEVYGCVEDLRRVLPPR